MSGSERTPSPLARDTEGFYSYQSFDGHVYGLGDHAVSTYEKSPYTDEYIISLDVGPSQTRFRIHRILLSQSSELDAKPTQKLWGEKTNETISLPEIDESTAHTLVHFLYTGKYQALKASGLNGAIGGYELGTCVYCAAVRYKLQGLAELAKGKIISFGEDLSILEVLRVAREYAFPLLPDDDIWFPDYLEDAIKNAVANEPGLCMKPEFLDQIQGDRKSLEVVMRVMASTRSREQTMPMARPTQSSTSVSEAKSEATSNIDVKESVIPELLDTVVEDVLNPPNETIRSEEPVEAVKENSFSFGATEPPAQPPRGPEPVIDELGWANSKMYQKYGKGPDARLDVKPGSKPEPQAEEKSFVSTHTRSDSVTQITEVLPIVSSKAAEEKLAILATSEPPTADSGSTGTATPSKKKKKKAKKAAAAAAAALSNGTA